MIRILFDNGTPRKVAACLVGHQVVRSTQLGWQKLNNDDLIQKAKDEAFDVLLSTDKNIRYQQNLSVRKIALGVLTQQQSPLVQLHLSKIAPAINAVNPGSYTEVEIPFSL